MPTPTASNNRVIVIPTPTGTGWGSLTHAGIATSSSAVAVAVSRLPDVPPATTGAGIQFSIGRLRILLPEGDFAANFVRNNMLSPGVNRSLYLAFYTADPGPARDERSVRKWVLAYSRIG